MRRVCCHCGCSLGPDVPDPDGWDRARYGEPVSHGLCAACLEREYGITDPDPTGDGGPATW